MLGKTASCQRSVHGPRSMLHGPHAEIVFSPCDILFCFVFEDRVSLCSPGCFGTQSVDQAGLKLTEIPLPPKCWD